MWNETEDFIYYSRWALNMVSRRQFLGTVTSGVCGAVAGCHAGCGDRSWLEFTVADDTAALAQQAATLVGHEYYERVDSEEPAPSLRRVPLMEAAIGGTVTVHGSEPPLPANRLVVFNDTVYKVSWEQTTSNVLNSYRMRLYPADDASGSSIDFEELPEPDRKVLEVRWNGAGKQQYTDPSAASPAVVYEEDAVNDSVLVPSPEYDSIVRNGTKKEIVVTNEQIHAYTYTASERHTSLDAYGQHLWENYGFELADLSDEEQNIIEGATGSELYKATADNEAFDSVSKRLFEHDPAVRPDSADGEWPCRWDGQLYWSAVLHTDMDPGRVSDSNETGNRSA